MKTRIFFSVFLTLIIGSFYSQVENHIKWGPLNQHSRKDHESRIIGYDGQFFFSINTVSGFEPKVVLKKLDHVFKVVQTKTLNWNGTKSNHEFWSILLIDDQLLLFESENNQATTTSTLYLKTLSTETLNFTSSEIKISQVYYDEKVLSNYYFRFKRFNDKLLIKSFPTSKENGRIELRTIDFNGHTLWENTITSNKLHAEVFDEDDGYHFIQKREGNDYFTLNSLLKNGTEWIERNITYSDKIINRHELFINDKGNLVCTGLFLKESSYKHANYDKISGDLMGTYWYEYHNEKDSIIKEKYDTLNLAFRDELSTLVTHSKKGLMTERDKRSFSYAGSTKRRYSLNEERKWSAILETNYIIYLPANQRKAVRKTNQGILLTAIQSSTFLSSASLINQSYRIVLTHLSHEGEIIWSTSIPFYQYDKGESDMKLMGFDLIEHKDQLHVVFNDHPKNLKKKRTVRSFKRTSPHYVTDITINVQNGEQKQHLFLNKKTDLCFMPLSGGFLNEEEYVIKVTSGSKEKYGILNLTKAY